MAQQDDNIKRLYEELKNEYDVGSIQDFRNYLDKPENRKALYGELRNEYEINSEKDFDDYLGFGETTQAGIAAQQVVDEYDRSVAENGRSQQPQRAATQNVVTQNDNDVKQQEVKPTSQPRAQFVPEYSNVKGFTVAKDSPLRQQYPFLDQLGEDEQAYFRTDTNEPLYAWKDSEGKDITPDEAATLNQRADIEQNDAIRPRQVPVTSLQLPEEVKSSGIRTDKKVSEYADELLKKQHGDGYLDRQITLNDGTTVSGDEMLGKVSQQVYDNLNKQINEARVTYVSADNAGRERIINQFVNNYKGLLSEATVKRALEEHDALQEATAESERRNRAEWAQMKEDNPSFWQTLRNSVSAGFINFGAGLLDAIQQLTSGMLIEDPSRKEGYFRTRSYEEALADKNDPITKLTGILHGKAERLSKSAQPYKGKKGFLDMLWNGEITEFLQKGVATAGESLPMTLSAFNPYTMAINAISMAGSNFRQNTLDNPNIPAWKRAMQAIGSAAIEQAVEKYSDPIFKYVGGNKVLRGVSKENSEKIVRDVTEEAVNTLSGRIFNRLKGLAKDTAGEGVEEVMADAGNDLLGETLDLVSGSTDYGLRAQWEEFKEDNPNADLKTFAKNKAKEYVEDFIGGAMAGAYTSSTTQLSAKALQYSFDKIGAAQNQVDPTRLNPVQVDIAQSYDDGYNAESGEVAEMTDNYNRQRMKVESTFSLETVTEIDNDPISLLDSGSIKGEDMQTVIDYVNAKARYDGIMQRNSDDAETGVDHRNLHSDGMIHAAVLYPSAESGGQPQEVFIIKGDIVADANGKVDVEKSSDMITYRGADGLPHIASPDKFQSVAQPISVEEYAAANAPQESVAQTDNATTIYSPGDEVVLKDDNGNAVRGEIMYDANADGQYQVRTESPINGANVNLFTGEELDNLRYEQPSQQENITDEYSRFVDSGIVSDDTVARIADKIANGQQLTPEEESMRQGAVERVENLLKEKQTGQNGQPVQAEQPIQEAAKTAQTEQTSQPQQTEASVQEQTALSRIPVDEKGKPVYDKAEPDLAWDAIMEKTDGDEEMAKNVVDAMVKQQEAEVDKLKKKQPKAIPGDVDSMIAAQKEKKAAIAAAEERLEQWRKIADTPNRRAAATNVQPTQNPSDETSTQPATAIAPTENTGNVEPADTGNAQTTEQGTEVPTGVQGTVEDGTVPEEANRGEDKEYQLSETDTQSEQVKQDNIRTIDPRSMSNDERQQRGDMLRNAPAIEVKAGQIVSTPELSARKVAERWWDENVPEPVFYDTEVGEVEINKNSVESSLAHRYGQAKLDAITSLVDGFENAVYLGTLPDFTRQEGVLSHYFAYPIIYNDKRCYVFCRAMQDANKNRLYVHEVFVAENIKRGDTLQTAASQPHGGIALYKDILGNVLEEAPEQQSLLDGNNPHQYPANRELSENKDTQTSANEQTVGEKIAQEEAKVEQNPTEAQKEAGNYKKGHVKIDGYDVTIENPKGSVRKGTDRNGQKWSVTMNNTYGYIRGTEGVDGDHIDVYLSDDIENWDGKHVFVIDVYNEDSTFDEHKVMLGFNNAADAFTNYVRNYSPGFFNNRRTQVSDVSSDVFRKWINSSHRKTKPFAEYKSVNKDGAQNEPNVPRPIEGESPVDYARRLGESKSENKAQEQKGKAGKDLPLTETEYANMRMKELMEENPQLDEDDAENQALDEYPSYIGEKIKSGELENLYAELSINGQIKLSHIVESAGFDVSDISGKANKERQDEKKRNIHNVGEHITIEFNDGTLVTGEIIKAENGKITVLSDENKRKYTVPEKSIINTDNEANGNIRFREADNEISDFARKHNLNEKDVQDYADYMRQGNLNGASGAFTDIRRKVRIDNRGVSLGEFTKIFSPIRKELYEKFGNVDDMREQYVQAEMAERNMMEAARKRAEEAAEAERRRLQVFQDMTDKQLDEEYSKAVEANDESRMRDLVNEAARRNGYGDVSSEYQGVGAWSAPSNPGYESDEERRAAVENEAPDVNITDIANGYSQQPSDYFTNLRAYGTDTAHGRESAEAINKAINEVRNGKDPMVKVYRAVPKSVKEGKLRNGDWVTPSRKYAEMHGDNRLEGDYRIIEQEVPASQLWWDGNDINEWGFDDGKGYAYRNTKNNRKLNDLITRDDNGNIIPLSQRFNARKADVRYRNTESQAVTDNEIEEANRYFNSELDAFKAKTHKGLLHLGQPGRILNACGINTELTLSPTVLSRKLKQHGLNVDDIKGLAGAIQEPILVYQHGDVHPNTVIVTDLTAKGGKVSVAVELDGEGNVVELNNVSSIHSKDATTELERLSNMRDGYLEQALRWVDKNKVSDWLGIADLNSPIHANNPKLVSVANILQNFENPNVSEENLTRGDIDTAVADTANKLNIGVRVAHSVDEVSDEGVRRAIEKGRNVKGWYDTRTGEIVVYAPNATDADDAVRTVLHEGVAHYGLRQLVGDENFDTFLDNIYNNVDGEIKAAIDEKAQRHGWSTRVATEEYLASLAEDTNFEEAKSSGLWQKIKDFFMDLLTKTGVRLNEALTDNELRYLLWRSYENLAEPNGRDIIGTVRDVAMQGRLGVGNYGNEGVRLRETDNAQAQESQGAAQENDEGTTPTSAYIVDAWDKQVKSDRFKLVETGIDYLNAVDKFQKLIAKHSGKEIKSFENAYDAMTFLSSKNREEMDMFESFFVTPLNKAIQKLIGEKGGLKKWDWSKGPLRELVMYVEAKHGTERNRQMAVEAVAKADEKNSEAILKDWAAAKKRINEQEGTSWQEKQRLLDEAAASLGADLSKDYSGLSSVFGDKNVYPKGWQEESLEYVGKYESGHEAEDIKGLWTAIGNATGFALQKQYETGLVSREYVERQKERFDNYIPLRGFEDEIAGDVYSYLGHDFYPGSNPVKSAHGRTSEPGNPFGSILNTAYASISSGNKNVAKTALYSLVVNHDTGGLAVAKRAWMVKYADLKNNPELESIVVSPKIEGDEEIPEWVEAVPRIQSGSSAEDISRMLGNFEEVMKKYQKEDVTKPIGKKAKIAYKTLHNERNEHDIPLFIAGDKYIITITGNPRVAQAMNGLLNPDSGEENTLTEYAKKTQRFMSGAFTAKNAAFSFANLAKDTIYANNQAFIRENPKYWLRFTENQRLGFGDFIPMMRRLKRYRNGKLDLTKKRDRMFKEFMENGGATGYTFVNTQEEYAKELAKKLDELSKKTPKALSLKGLWNIFFDTVEFMGQAAELVNRFAAYKTSREMGRTVNRSIRDAKEITVNFNRKGAGRKTADKNNKWYINLAAATSQYGRTSILFWNANMQAKYRFFKNIQEHPIKTSVTLIANSMAIGGAIIPFINNLALPALYEMFGIGGDDDDDDYYNALTDWERTHNICLRLPKGYWLKIPLSPEMTPWYSMGDAIGGAASGQRDLSAKDFMESAIDAVSPLSINWSYSGSQMLLNALPTVMQPIAQNMMNVNFMGNPIKKTPFTRRQGKNPEYTMVYKSASPTLVELSRLSNRILGGEDDKTAGEWRDWNPAMVQNLISGYAGGYGTTILSIADWIVNTSKGEKQAVAFSKIPFVSRFVISGNKDVKRQRINSRYNDVKEFVTDFEFDMGRYEKRVEEAQKKADPVKLSESMSEYDKLLSSERTEKYMELYELDRSIKYYEDYLDEFPDDEVTQNLLYNLKQTAIETLKGEKEEKEKGKQ